MAADDITPYIQGLQLLGGILSLPRQSQYAQQQAVAGRRMLADTGMEQSDINALYPDAPLQWLAPGEGIGGKILGGVGDVGALLSTIAGKPIGPPRMDISDIAAAAKMRKSFKEQQELDKLATTESDLDPTARMLLKAGNMDGFARYQAAKLRNAPGAGFGTSALGQRARLEYYRKYDPNNKEIPALEYAIKEDERLHPPGQPPRTTAQELELDRQKKEQADSIEQQRREKEIARNPQWTPDQKAYYHANGSLPAPQRDQPFDFRRDIYPKVYEEHAARAKQIAHDDGPDAPGATIDADEVMRESLQRAEAYRQQGVDVRNVPPSPPPSARETGIGMSRGETEPPTVPGGPPSTTPTTGPTTTTTSSTLPKKPSLGDVELIPPAQRTPKQQAALDAVIAQGKAKGLSTDIIRQRIRAIPGLVAQP